MANIITISRIILSVTMLITKPYSYIFFIIYTICGITDILDGYIARKTNTQSEKGAKLDTIVDLIFFSIITMIVFQNIIQEKIYIISFIIIALIRIISIIITFKKYKEVSVLHTYSNKISGILVFLIPYFIRIDRLKIIIYIICFVCFISAIEELIITVSSKSLDRNIKYLKFKSKKNKK